jgi:hypothetical protein
MHSGSGFGPPGSNLKCNSKVKNPKLEANFLGNNASNIEKSRTKLEPKPEPEPKPKIFPKVLTVIQK